LVEDLTREAGLNQEDKDSQGWILDKDPEFNR